MKNYSWIICFLTVGGFSCSCPSDELVNRNWKFKSYGPLNNQVKAIDSIGTGPFQQFPLIIGFKDDSTFHAIEYCNKSFSNYEVNESCKINFFNGNITLINCIYGTQNDSIKTLLWEQIKAFRKLRNNHAFSLKNNVLKFYIDDGTVLKFEELLAPVP